MQITNSENVRRHFDDAVKDADRTEARRNAFLSNFWASGKASELIAYQKAEKKMRKKQRRGGSSMMDVFLGRIASLEDTDYDEEELGNGVPRLIDNEETVDNCDDGVIDNETGPSDGYCREAEQVAMNEEEIQKEGTIHVAESA